MKLLQDVIFITGGGHALRVSSQTVLAETNYPVDLLIAHRALAADERSRWARLLFKLILWIAVVAWQSRSKRAVVYGGDLYSFLYCLM